MSSKTQALPPVWILWTLLAGLILYLIPEIAFNLVLTDTAGGAGNSHHLKNVELFGRALSGVGVSLLVFDLIIRKKSKHWKTSRIFLGENIVKFIFTGIFVFAVVWPLVFYGQKIIIEKLLVEPADAQTRQAAHYTLLLRNAIKNKTLEVEGVPFDADREFTQQDKVFLTIFGSIILGNERALEKLNKQKETITANYVKNNTYENFDSYYDAYKQTRAEAVELFNGFSALSESYQKDIQYRISNNVAKHIVENEDNDLKRYFEEYQTKNDEMARFWLLKSMTFPAELEHAVLLYASCIKYSDKADCDEKSERHGYKKVMEDHFLSPDIPIKDWLEIRKIETGRFSLSPKRELNVFFDKPIPEGYAVYGFKKEKFRAYRKKKSHEAFEQATFFPPNIKSFATFRQHHKSVNKFLIARATKMGILLPEDWKRGQNKIIYQTIQMKKFLEFQSSSKAPEGWKPINVALNSNWKQFTQSPEIQMMMRTVMGGLIKEGAISFDMNNKRFLAMVIEPFIQSETKRINALLGASVDSFEVGAENYQAGNEVLRALVVPPVAMGLSLLLIILTLFKLPFKLVEVVFKGRKSKVGNKKWLKPALNGVMIIGLVGIPLTMIENDYTKSDSVVSFLLNEVHEQSPVKAVSMQWVMATQPLLTIDALVSPFETFINNEGWLMNGLNRLDKYSYHPE